MSPNEMGRKEMGSRTVWRIGPFALVALYLVVAAFDPLAFVALRAMAQSGLDEGTGAVEVAGEQRVWHKIVLTQSGPHARELDRDPNPFLDYRMTVTFQHTDGTTYVIPGYFAADGDAANTSADAGNRWRAVFAPDRPGNWEYRVSFVKGKHVAIDASADGLPVSRCDGQRGALVVTESNKPGRSMSDRDFRGHGRLNYVGARYLQFAGSKQYFLKIGADAPETLLAYEDFDNTISRKPDFAPIKSWAPHVKDWRPGDPTWKQGKGKGLIGAINYLSGKGCNAFSFLTYNAGGDGDNVWPFVERETRLHYDCSKLDQWAIVLDHGTAMGMYLHFKLQETENDDNRRGNHSGKKGNPSKPVKESLDGGALGVQRKLYLRELMARFGHNLALNWNLGEENTQTTEEQIAMLDYLAAMDAYGHHRVVHTFPNQQDKVYDALLGDRSSLTGTSLQNSRLETTHAMTCKWVERSADAGKPWVVAFDESGSAAHGQCPDLGYRGFDGHDNQGKMTYSQHAVRWKTLWGTLMGGGAGCEYYFGYQFVENDILCEDWRSRDQSWDHGRIAINFFHHHEIPFWDMENADALVGNTEHGPREFCLAKPDEVYLVYLPPVLSQPGIRKPAHGQEGDDPPRSARLDLSAATGTYQVHWFDPCNGGSLQRGSVTTISGGGERQLGDPPVVNRRATGLETGDWLVLLRRIEN